MKIKAIILTVLLFGIIVATVAAVSAGIPPSNAERSSHARVPDVFELAPANADTGLGIADSHVPDTVPQPF